MWIRAIQGTRLSVRLSLPAESFSSLDGIRMGISFWILYSVFGLLRRYLNPTIDRVYYPGGPPLKI